MKGKIALEEHFENPAYPTVGEGPFVTASYLAEVARKRHDPALRIAEMDQFGIEATIVSLTSPGI